MKLLEFNKTYAVIPYERTVLFAFYELHEIDNFIKHILSYCKENKINRKNVYVDILMRNGIHNRSFVLYVTNDYNFKYFGGDMIINKYILGDIVKLSNTFYILYEKVINIQNNALFPERILTYLHNYQISQKE